MHAILPLMVLSALASAPQFDVQLLDGSKVSGSLVQWDAAQLVVETSTGRTTLQTGKLASVTPHSPPADSAAKPAVWVDLVDGSQLAGLEYTVEKGRAKIAFSAGEVARNSDRPDRRRAFAAGLRGDGLGVVADSRQEDSRRRVGDR